MATNGKKQSRKAKKKELNKALEEASKTKDPLEMTAAELSNSPEYQALKRKYEKKQTLKEFKQWYQRHFRILEDIRSRSSKEEWENFWEWYQDPDFQFEFTWDEWVGKGSKEEDEESSNDEDDIEDLIQRAQNMWSNLFQRCPQNLLAIAAGQGIPPYPNTTGWKYQ